jgi:hypothetical protein
MGPQEPTERVCQDCRQVMNLEAAFRNGRCSRRIRNIAPVEMRAGVSEGRRWAQRLRRQARNSRSSAAIAVSRAATAAIIAARSISAPFREQEFQAYYLIWSVLLNTPSFGPAEKGALMRTSLGKAPSPADSVPSPQMC